MLLCMQSFHSIQYLAPVSPDKQAFGLFGFHVYTVHMHMYMYMYDCIDMYISKLKVVVPGVFKDVSIDLL